MAKSIELRALLGLALVSVLVLELAGLRAAAFPSLFNVRAHSIFRRQQQQQQPQQQPQPHPATSVGPPQETLVALGNEPAFGQHQFGAARAPLPVELMRINAAARQTAAVHPIGAHQLQQTLLSSAASQPHQQRHQQFAFADSVEHDDQFSGPLETGFYMPQAAVRQPEVAPSGGSLGRQQQLSRPAADQPAAAFELSDSTGDYFASPIQGDAKRGANEAPASQMHREPSHTSEIVDKIEQHIGQQVQHGLQQHAAASGYQQHAEKEPSEETGGGGGGGESAGAMEEGEEKVEKRHEEGGKEAQEGGEHHHHMEHHAPEAFEVHHKKGGKSFQYFHMGHHH